MDQKDKFLCHCMKVSKETIIDCIKNGCSSLEEIVQCTKAGSCCNSCHFKIYKTLKETNHEST